MFGRIVGVQQTNTSPLYERRVTQKAKVIAMDPGHTLAVQYQLAPPFCSMVLNATVATAIELGGALCPGP